MRLGKAEPASLVNSALVCIVCYKVSKAMAESVKKSVDVIYELTKDGYDGTFTSLGSHSVMKVLTELVKRGVLEKTRKGKSFHYQWVANSAPTPQFYVNVAGKLGKHQAELDKKSRARRKQAQSAEMPDIVLPEDITPVEEETPAEVVKTLSDYTLSELWAEMQSRGVVIEDNHLVVIEKKVIA